MRAEHLEPFMEIGADIVLRFARADLVNVDWRAGLAHSETYRPHTEGTWIGVKYSEPYRLYSALRHHDHDVFYELRLFPDLEVVHLTRQRHYFSYKEMHDAHPGIFVPGILPPRMYFDRYTPLSMDGMPVDIRPVLGRSAGNVRPYVMYHMNGEQTSWQDLFVPEDMPEPSFPRQRINVPRMVP